MIFEQAFTLCNKDPDLGCIQRNRSSGISGWSFGVQQPLCQTGDYPRGSSAGKGEKSLPKCPGRKDKDCWINSEILLESRRGEFESI